MFATSVYLSPLQWLSHSHTSHTPVIIPARPPRLRDSHFAGQWCRRKTNFDLNSQPTLPRLDSTSTG